VKTSVARNQKMCKSPKLINTRPTPYIRRRIQHKKPHTFIT